jgi:hypothetical protein
MLPSLHFKTKTSPTKKVLFIIPIEVGSDKREWSFFSYLPLCSALDETN